MNSSDRDRQMTELYAAGETLAAIGDQFGVTRERVRQIVRKAGGAAAEAARATRANLRAASAQEARDAFMEEFGELAEELAALGYPREAAVDRITSVFPSVDRELAVESLRESRIVFLQAPVENHFSIAELQAGLWFLVGSNERLDPDLNGAARDLPLDILEAVPLALEEADVTPQDVSTILGVIAAARDRAAEDPALTITGARYEELRLELVEALGLVSAKGQTPWPPTRQTLMKRFGGWNEGLQSIGLALASKGRAKGLVVYSEREYLVAVRDYYHDAQAVGTNPTFAGYGEWAAEENSAGRRRPSPASVRLQYGTWLEALQQARRAAEEASIQDQSVVGPEWTPLVIAMVGLTNGLRSSQVWRMDTYLGALGFDPNASPYAQLLVAEDGSRLVEVRDPKSDFEGAEKQLAKLRRLGWSRPEDGIPNPHRRYEGDSNAVEIATDVILALSSVLELTVDDLVSFGGKSDEVRQFRVLVPVSDGAFRIEAFEEDIPDELPSLEDRGDFDTAVEIMARLLEAGIIDAPGMPITPDRVGGPVRRQGVRYQHSGFSDNDIVGWTVDVTSWTEPAAVDWVDHIERLGGDMPLVLITGASWALTVSAGQQDSEVPDGLVRRLMPLLPHGWVQWSGGQDAAWFDPRFTHASAILEELATAGFVVKVQPPAQDIGEYLVESLEDDTFTFFSVSAPGGPAALGCVLIDENFAANAAYALDGYLPSGGESATIAADGWTLRILSGESLEIGPDEYAEQLAEALGATFSDSEFVDLAGPTPPIDTTEWGPQVEGMKSMLLWASSFIFAVPQESWDDERERAWGRVSTQIEEIPNRARGSQEAESLMSMISTNDFFDHTGVEALRALAARDLIAKEDYDTFTLPWRKLVGPIHPDDSDVERTRGTDLDGARQSKFSRGPD